MSFINIKLNIHQPGIDGVTDEIVFTKIQESGDVLRIPRRYPFVDIANYQALRERGYFRHATTEVSSELGGSAVSNTEGKLGFQLPPTEKLILLVKRTGVAGDGTPAQEFQISNSHLHQADSVVVSWKADSQFTQGVKLYEIDLYNFGLYIDNTVYPEEQGIQIITDEDLEFALIARMG